MSRLVVFSDLHVDATTAGVERLPDVEEALDQVADHVRAVNADVAICLGDLCDPDARNLVRSVCVAQRAARNIGAGCGSVWLAGNHDVLEDGHGTTVLDPIGAESSAIVVTRPRLLELGHLAIACLPYTALAQSYDPVAELRRMAAECDPSRVQAVITHLMLEGHSIGSESTDFPRGCDVFFPVEEAKSLFPGAVLLAGHYHNPECYQGVHIPGSLVRLTRADAGRQPCFLEIDI